MVEQLIQLENIDGEEGIGMPPPRLGEKIFIINMYSYLLYIYYYNLL